MIVDADEFLNIRVGDNDPPSLFATLPEIDAISFNQVVFGSAKVEVFQDRPVARQFNHRFQGAFSCALAGRSGAPGASRLFGGAAAELSVLHEPRDLGRWIAGQI
jgi:hypothetical protein